MYDNQLKSMPKPNEYTDADTAQLLALQRYENEIESLRELRRKEKLEFINGVEKARAES
jgi:hypothetical protein